MPRTLRLRDGSYVRRFDVYSIIQYLFAVQSVELIGISNIGKSALLRLLAQPDVWIQELGEVGKEFLPVYIDCNHMLEMSDQGFYELVLRSLRDTGDEFATLSELSAAYNNLVTPSSEFQIPLSFNNGLTAALQATKRKILLLFDEFDEPFTQIDSRVFLNLRALKDRHNSQLAYVTATGQPLVSQRHEDHCAEFCELFSQRSWSLAPQTRPDVNRIVRRYMEAYEADFTMPDIDFIYEWAGGHPVMIESVCQLLETAINKAEPSEIDVTDRWMLHRTVVKHLRTDENLNLECTKIWEQCSAAEQEELLALFVADHKQDMDVIAGLVRRHILLKIDNRYQPFCRLLTEFIHRKISHTQPESTTLWVDVESGAVMVGGDAVATLTNLEYKLMLLLFENAEKIVDKYQIVTQVWGESYIDEVDDARIEKLVSRLRQKIEPDSGSPRFLTTVRGRGYRLNVA